MLMEAVPGLVKTRLYSGQTVRFHVHTNSMIPLIQPGDVLVVHKLGMEKPAPGTVVIVHTGRWWLAHRLLVWRSSKDYTTIITKGDNCVRVDPDQQSSSIYGSVETIIREGREINLMTFRSKLGGKVIAVLSLWQNNLYKPDPILIKKIVSSLLRRALWIISKIVYSD